MSGHQLFGVAVSVSSAIIMFTLSSAASVPFGLTSDNEQEHPGLLALAKSSASKITLF